MGLKSVTPPPTAAFEWITPSLLGNPFLARVCSQLLYVSSLITYGTPPLKGQVLKLQPLALFSPISTLPWRASSGPEAWYLYASTHSPWRASSRPEAWHLYADDFYSHTFSLELPVSHGSCVSNCSSTRGVTYRSQTSQGSCVWSYS